MSDSSTWEAIVVGLGPAGATAAYELARRGVRVLALEQKRHPRSKPCGGCLSLKIDRILEPDFHPLIEKTVYGAAFTFEGMDAFRIRSDRPVAYKVSRDRFDHFLVEKARRAGAEIREEERVLHVAEEADRVRVGTARGEYAGRFLVGADGVSGVVARALGMVPEKVTALCLEGEVQTQRVPSGLEDEVRIDFGSVPFGYGWVFPKTGHLSLGVGGLREKIRNPRDYYEEFLVDQELLEDIVSEKRQGWAIPVFAGGGRCIATRRTVLVGDAAALVDPFLGEGIYYAIRSGQLAAQAVGEALAGAAEGGYDEPVQTKLHEWGLVEKDSPRLGHTYEELVAAELYPEFRAARKMALFLYGFPRIGYDILKGRPAFVKRYFDVLRGDASYGELWRELRGTAGLDLLRSLWPAPAEKDVARHYDRIALQYDSRLGLWRELVAAPAWDRLEELLRRHVRAGARVLDAGTGTGAAVEKLLAVARPGSVVGVDISKGMLWVARRKVKDGRVRFKVQDVTHLPYPDESFDVVLSTWVLETLPDPRAAVREFLRLIKPEGYVIYALSSTPEAGRDRLYAGLLERAYQGTLRWHLLGSEERPFHHCSQSSLATFARGLATVAVLRKCCSVDAPDAPCLPVSFDSQAGGQGE